MAHTHVTEIKSEKLVVSNKLKGIIFSFLLIGALTLVIGFFTNKDRTWQAFLLSFFFFTSIALGGLFFTAIQYVTNAGWSATVRRIAESLSTFLPVAAIGAVLIVGLGAPYLFEWVHPDVVSADELLHKKEAYLNMPAWAIRTAIFFGLWFLFSKIIVGNSLKQDVTGAENLTTKNVRNSILFILFFAISYSLFSVDFVMSLQPHWFSTIFGIYCFAGLFQSALAFIIITVVKLLEKGYMKDVVNDEHLHELGTFMFAFTVFYAYIAFSQFMLIWYANLPEETIFYAARGHGVWMAISMSILIFKFVVPFLMLLPRAAKRDKGHLVRVGALIIFMQMVDVYWLMYPNFNEGQVAFGYQEVGLFLGFLGLFLTTMTRFLSKNNIVALKDPYAKEALTHQSL